MQRTLLTKWAVAGATVLALAALALPALLPPASGAGDGVRVGATALVSSARGAVLLASVTGARSATKVSFTCRPRGSASTRTLGGVSTDTVASRVVGLAASRVTRCTAKAGESSRAVRPLRGGARAGGARLVAILGAVRALGGGVARIDVAISGAGRITVETAGGRRLQRTGRRDAGLHRLRVPGAPRGSIVVVNAVGRTDAAVVGGTLTAAPTATPAPSSSPTPTPTPAPTATPTPAPGSTLTIACPARAQAGAPIDVSGTLAPAGAGNTIVVRFTQPTGAFTQQSVLTDAAGNYAAQATPGANSPGPWSSQATFAGSGAVPAVQSPACSTTVG